MHIPKTAGTTLRSIIDFQYGRENVLTFYNQNNQHLLDNIGFLLRTNPNYKVLIGHYQFGVHENIEKRSLYIAFLRNPIARCISEYNERIERDPETYCNNDGTVFSLSQMIDYHHQDFSNLQTKYICGVPKSTQITNSHLTQAIANIQENFLYVGVVERFDQAIKHLSKNLNWRKYYYESLNRKENRAELNDNIIQKLIELNKYDIELFENYQNSENKWPQIR